MLQIVLKRKFFIKWPLSHQLPYIKLFFKKMHALYYTDVQKHNEIIDQIITQSDENQSLRIERQLGVCPTLKYILVTHCHFQKERIEIW